MSARPIRVLCVEDNLDTAEALRLRIAIASDLQWVGHLEQADELCDHARASEPDVVLLDIDMPGLNAFEALARLGEVCPSAKVIMLTAFVRADYLDKAMDAGAWGYLSKIETPAEIIQAVRRVALGQVNFGGDVVEQCMRGTPQPVAKTG